MNFCPRNESHMPRKPFLDKYLCPKPTFLILASIGTDLLDIPGRKEANRLTIPLPAISALDVRANSGEIPGAIFIVSEVGRNSYPPNCFCYDPVTLTRSRARDLPAPSNFTSAGALVTGPVKKLSKNRDSAGTARGNSLQPEVSLSEHPFSIVTVTPIRKPRHFKLEPPVTSADARCHSKPDDVTT